MFTTQNLQYFTSKFYDKIKNTFLSKEDGVKGVILGQDWELVNSVVANNPITLPSIDTFEEIYIETQSNDATIVHQVSLNKDSLLFESTNTTHREILIDSLLDVQTYATYSIADNTITLSSYEGTDVDNTSTTITTKVYVKKMSEVNGTIPSSRVTYDDTTTQLGANSLQNAIEKVDNKVKNITLSAENTTYDNSTSGMYATNVQEAIDDLSEATSNLPSVGTQITGVLNAGETEITFANENITSDSTLNAVYTSKYGVSVNSAVFGEGTLTLTFSAQEENIDVLVVIDASLSYGGNGSDGKSAYEYAVEGGYTGTEEEFAQLFNNMGNASGGSEWKEIPSSCIDTSSADNRKINLNFDAIINNNYDEILIIASLNTSYKLTFLITKKELEYLKNNYTQDTIIKTYYDGSSQCGLWFCMSSGIMRFNIVGTPTIKAYYR